MIIFSYYPILAAFWKTSLELVLLIANQVLRIWNTFFIHLYV